jgi:hypothetical protein
VHVSTIVILAVAMNDVMPVQNGRGQRVERVLRKLGVEHVLIVPGRSKEVVERYPIDNVAHFALYRLMQLEDVGHRYLALF